MTNLRYLDAGAGIDTLIGSDAWAGDLRGGAGNDIIGGGALNDLLAGGAGADTFVVTGGADTITDLTFKSKAGVTAGQDDMIDLTAYNFDDYTTDVHDQITTQVGKHVLIDFGGGNTLKINNTTIAILDAHANDFLLSEVVRMGIEIAAGRLCAGAFLDIGPIGRKAVASRIRRKVALIEKP